MKSLDNTKNPKKPVTAWLFWMVGFFALNFILLMMQGVFNPHSFKSLIFIQSLCEIGIVIIALIINHFYTKEQLLFKHWNFFSYGLFDFFFIYYILGIISLHEQMHHIAGYLLLTIMIGIAEEISFRGVLLSSFIHNWRGKHPLLGSILISSLFFGITHAVNAFSQPLSNTIVQIVVAFSLGVILALMYLVSGNLIMPIIIHALIDFTSISLSNTTESQAGWQTAIPLLVLALIILIIEMRPKMRAKMQANFEKNR